VAGGAVRVGYYLKSDLGFIPHVADAYTCGGQKGNDIPVATLGNQWETILDRATSRGVSVGYYVSDLPFPALYGPRGLAWVRPVA
jgi:hypothetical protein